jgi:hypothetical protein
MRRRLRAPASRVTQVPSRLEVVHRGGHLFIVQRPRDVVPIIMSFLAGMTDHSAC